ncbi:Essential recombination function protein [uncultured Caudovirales phage]|uniref:Essential recombination function protein n=1 Tax=uncultured Caudovirales phage TaxID=2100421 RepID=A0A6J5N1E1_9CAUD|nr:Essential recombination function protein [uncultured Caudovirales phage]
MEHSKIAAAFVKAQMSFSPALKTSTNPHFKSKYVNLDGCIEAVIDALGANGIALIQKTHECDTGVAVETVLMHESGEQISGGILRVPAIKNDAQAYGSALTYARRYSLMATCGIAPEDDDGNAASKPLDKSPKKIERITPKQVADIYALTHEVHVDGIALLAWVSKAVGFDVDALEDVPATAYEPIIKQLEKKRSAA